MFAAYPPSSAQLSRPRRTLPEAFVGLRVASLSDRGHHLAQLYAQLPSLLVAQPIRRIYQLPYLAHSNLHSFVAGFAARKVASLGLLGNLTYGEDELGMAMCDEPVGVQLLCCGRPGHGVVAVLPMREPAYALPVPSRLFLGWLFVAANKVLW